MKTAKEIRQALIQPKKMLRLIGIKQKAKGIKLQGYKVPPPPEPRTKINKQQLYKNIEDIATFLETKHKQNKVVASYFIDAIDLQKTQKTLSKINSKTELH